STATSMPTEPHMAMRKQRSRSTWTAVVEAAGFQIAISAIMAALPLQASARLYLRGPVAVVRAYREIVANRTRTSPASAARHRFAAREKMPSRLGSRPAIAQQVTFLLGRCQVPCFARVEADRHHFKLLSRVERHFQHPLHQPVEHERAEPRTLIVGQHENNGAA